MKVCYTRARRWAASLAASTALAALAQTPNAPNDTSALPDAVVNPSSGALIDVVPRTPSMAYPVAVPAPVLPPVNVNPATGVVPMAPGAVGPLVRPEVGRSGIDALQYGRPANAPNAESPAQAAQRQLMIEREDRMRSLNR